MQRQRHRGHNLLCRGPAAVGHLLGGGAAPLLFAVQAVTSHWVLRFHGGWHPALPAPAVVLPARYVTNCRVLHPGNTLVKFLSKTPN